MVCFGCICACICACICVWMALNEGPHATAAIASACACRHEVGNEGDSVLVAFRDANDAVGWCLGMQTLLKTADWPIALDEHCKLMQQSEPLVHDTLLDAMPWPFLVLVHRLAWQIRNPS